MHEKWVASKVFQTKDWVCGITINTNTNILYFTTGSGQLYQFDLREDDNAKPIQLQLDSNLGKYDLTGIVWDGFSSLYMCDYENRILQYDVDTTNVIIIAGTGEYGHNDGYLQEAMFRNPTDIALSQKGDLYILENEFIRTVNLTEGTVSSIVVRGAVSGWVGLCVTEDALFIAEHSNAIYQWRDCTLSVIAGTPGVNGLQDGTEALLNSTCGLILLKDKRSLLFVDGDYLRSIDLCNYNKVTTLRLNRLCNPRYMTMDAEGNVYVGELNAVTKLQDMWKLERLLWIGHLKEDARYCYLASIPREIVGEIVKCLYSTEPWPHHRELSLTH